MEIDRLQTYQDVIKYLATKGRTKHLLLGNGFSMAYDSKIFSYNALSTFIEKTNNDLLKKLFSIINTKNFELIMQQLDNFCELAQTFSSDTSLIDKITEASATLKSSLIDAVKELHPEHVFIIPEEKSKSCSLFLDSYIAENGSVFSTNYDLLLYWVLMRNNLEHAIDGFGRDLENPGDHTSTDDLVFSELRWGKYKERQTIFHLHGTLPIFDTGVDIVKEEYNDQNYLLENINLRMGKKEYPIFVTAGNAKEKLNHIMHNKYLTYCYDRFSTIQGSLITFGFNFGDYDTHIIDAINKAAHYGGKSGEKLFSVYIGVYSDTDLEHIYRIESKFKCKVNLYDARTVNAWGL